LLIALAANAQPPGDALPPGAKLRLGTTRMRDAAQWSGAVLSLDGKLLLANTPAGFISVDVSTGLPVGKPSKPPAGLYSKNEISADGTRVLSVTTTGVVLWEPATGKTIAKLDRRMPYDSSVGGLSADSKLIAVGGAREDQKKDSPVTALVWDVEKKEKRAEVTVLQNQSANVALSPDGLRLATWGTHFEQNPAPGGRVDLAKDFARIVQFWDTTTGKETSRIRLDGFGMLVVLFVPDGKSVALGSSSGSVLLVDPQTGNVQRQFFGRMGIGHRIAFSPDGKLLASASSDASIQMWQTTDGKSVAITEGPFGSSPTGVRELRFVGPDRVVAWSQIGAAAVVWEAPSGKLLSTLGGHTGGVMSVVFTAGGKEVLTGGQDGQILRWEAATGKELGEVPIHVPGQTSRTTFGAVTFDAKGTTALVDRFGRGIHDLATGKQLLAIPGYGDSRAVLAPDARTLLFVPYVSFDMDAPKTMKVPVWDVVTGTKLAELDVPAGELIAVTVTPDRSKLITALTTRGGKDKPAALLITGWDLAAGGKKLGEASEKAGFGTVMMMAVPDNISVFVGLPDDRFVQIDATSGKNIREFDASRQRVTAMPVFAPDGRSFAVGLGAGFGNSSGTVRIFDATSGKPIRNFKGHTSLVLCLAYSPDGKTLVSGSADTTALLWDVDSKGE
jgi:WD40 repeat protein